jgi:hypothetical protein
MMERRAADMSKDKPSSDSEGRMCRLESGGVRRPLDVKCERLGRVVSVPSGTRKLESKVGIDFVV